MTTRGLYIGGRLTYFDSSTKRWTQRHSEYQFSENFEKYTSLETTAANGNPWEGATVETGGTPTTGFAAVNGVGKVYQAALDATDEAQTALADFNEQLVLSLDRSLVIQYVARASVLPTLVADGWVGVSSARNTAGIASTTYNAGFIIDVAGAVSARHDDNATVVSASTGVTMTLNQWYTFRIEFLSLTACRYFIDDVRVASGTTFNISAISTGANRLLQPSVGIAKASGVGVGTIQVRNFSAWMD